MKKNNLVMNARAAIAALALVVFAGCDGYDDTAISGRLDNIEDRVTTLEEATAALKTRLDAGSLIKSVTPITEAPGGWRIEFTGGSPSIIDILNGEDGTGSNPDPGADGITPQIEVRPGSGGTVTIWYKTDGDWTDTGVNIAGSQGGQGVAGTDGVSPHVQVVDNGDGTVTIQYNVTAGYPPSGWTEAGDPIALDSNPDDKTAIFSIVENEATGTITITLNDSDVPEERTVFDFAMASGAARIELAGFNDKVAITEGETAEIRFRVNPSDAFVPLTLDKWQLDQTGTRETRASYVTAPTDFELASIEKDGDRDGQYIATIECLAYNPAIADYAMALVLNTGTDTEPALVSSPTFVLGARVPVTYTPLTWDEVQSVVDGMQDRDILDLSGVPQFPGENLGSDETITITVDKDITIIAEMNPVQDSYEPFINVHFVLEDNSTLTFDEVEIHASDDTEKPLVSGNGNVIVKTSSLHHTAPIDIDGDVWVYGTLTNTLSGPNFTTEIIAAQSDDNNIAPKPGIRARNVTIYGGTVAGGAATGLENSEGTAKGSPAIEASGNVTLTGELVEVSTSASTVIRGGEAFNGNTGGDAIVVAGTLTVTGAAGILGGPSTAALGPNTGEGGIGGTAIVAGGDVSLSGTRTGTSYSVYVRSGEGEYQTGVPFKFSADGDGRTLTANTAMISGRNVFAGAEPPVGGYPAPYTMELQANDRALLDDCTVGWYDNIPIFSGGYYKITNPYNTWGTLDNATELP